MCHDQFWVYFWLDEEEVQVIFSQSWSVVDAKPITFRHMNENCSSCKKNAEYSHTGKFMINSVLQAWTDRS